jgi:hypothetical protein
LKALRRKTKRSGIRRLSKQHELGGISIGKRVIAAELEEVKYIAASSPVSHNSEIQRRHGYRDFHHQPEHFRLVHWGHRRICGTAYFSVLKRTSKYFRSCSQSLSFSVSERLALYGSSALSGVEHLRLFVGKDSVADALIRHFGSLKALSRASFQELRQFLTRRQAEAVMAALSMGAIADTEHALLTPLTNAEAIYKANLDMKGFHQEVVRVVLLDSASIAALQKQKFPRER